MPASDFFDMFAASLEENEKRKRRNLRGDRLLKDSQALPVAGEEKPKVSDLLLLMGATALSPLSSAISLTESALRPESSIFDNRIPTQEGDLYPERTEAVVPRLKKVQRKAQQLLHKFPTKEDYLNPRKNPELYTGTGREDWGTGIATRRPVLVPDYVKPDTVQIVSDPKSRVNDIFLGGKPVGGVSVDREGQIILSQIDPQARGIGLGKTLYKYLGEQGKDIFNLSGTSTAAARARYSAIKDLAEGKFDKLSPIRAKANWLFSPNPGDPLKIPGKLKLDTGKGTKSKYVPKPVNPPAKSPETPAHQPRQENEFNLIAERLREAAKPASSVDLSGYEAGQRLNNKALWLADTNWTFNNLANRLPSSTTDTAETLADLLRNETVRIRGLRDSMRSTGNPPPEIMQEARRLPPSGTDIRSNFMQYIERLIADLKRQHLQNE